MRNIVLKGGVMFAEYGALLVPMNFAQESLDTVLYTTEDLMGDFDFDYVTLTQKHDHQPDDVASAVLVKKWCGVPTFKVVVLPPDDELAKGRQ